MRTRYKTDEDLMHDVIKFLKKHPRVYTISELARKFHVGNARMTRILYHLSYRNLVLIQQVGRRILVIPLRRIKEIKV